MTRKDADAALIDAVSRIGTEDSKSYIMHQYQDIATGKLQPPKPPGKRAFVVERRKFADFAFYHKLPNSPRDEDPVEGEDKESSESELEFDTSLLIPPLPRVPVAPPKLSAVALPEKSGLVHLENVSRNLSNELTELETLATQISSNVVKLEASSVDCKHLAELSRVMSGTSLQQLKHIHEMGDGRNEVAGILQFFKSLFGVVD